jgi:quercetin dioxygenase-like cupin family protein
MNDMATARYGIDAYLDWVAAEGVPVVEAIGVQLLHVQTAPWARYGMDGAAIHLRGRGDFSNMMVFDIAPGGASAPLRHLYEDVIYVLEGRGNTEIELADGRKRSFEWGEKSLFSIPLNARHRHFNASGQKRARFATTTNLPLLLNAFHNVGFVFENPFAFADRTGSDAFYEGQGQLITVRQGNHMWETNFVPSLEDIQLQAYNDRGPGSMNIKIVLADGSMHAHVSEMQSGTYKKGHRHGAGFHVMCVLGKGYSLAWYEGDQDFTRLDWEHGFVFPPADLQFHQHFTTSATPARYLATAVGGIRYPFTAANRRTYLGAKPGEKGASSTSIKQGGDQIEFEDQDPRVHRIWLDEMAQAGLTPKM